MKLPLTSISTGQQVKHLDKTHTQKRQMRVLRRRGTDIRSILADRMKGGGSPRLVIYAICCLLVLVTIILHAGEAFEYTTEPLAKGFVYMPESGEVLARNIPDGKKNLKAFRIQFAPFEEELEEKTCEIEVCFYRNGAEVRTWTFPASELRDDPERIFEFGKRIRVSAEDHCRFTVVEHYENDEEDPLVQNQVGLCVTGRQPDEGISYEEYTGVEAADLDGSDESGNSEDSYDSGDSEDEEEAAGAAHLRENGICYQLTLEDDAMCGSVMRPFVAFLVLLCIAAAFVLDFRRIRMSRLIVLTLVLIVLAGTIPATLMQQIVHDVPLHDLENDDVMLKMDPGATLEQTFEADINSFTALELSIDGSDNRSQNVHILLEKDGEEEAYYDDDIPRAQLLSGGPAGRRIRITADQTSAGEVFPQGTYHIAITNTDRENKLRISMLEKTLAEVTDEGERQEDGQSNADNGGSDEDAEDADGGGDDSESQDYSSEDYSGDGVYQTYGTNSDDEGAGNTEEDITELREGAEVSPLLALNYRLTRSSGLGYGIACVVFSLLAVYILLVVFVTGLSHVSAVRFFIVSAVPLGLIYLILMLPWSVPDTGSHILATYRLSNIVMGADQDAEWQVRAQDADFFPVEWKEGKIETPFLPDTEDYARVFLRSSAGKDESAESDGRKMVDYFADRKMEYYSILCYLPQVIGFSLGRLLHLGTAGTLYLGRALILIAYMAACARAIRITPVGKGVFASIALLPMCLMLSSSYSYDAMVMISTISFTASILRLCHELDSRFALAESAIWAFAIGGVKGGGYLILLPLVLILFMTGRRNGVTGSGMSGVNDKQVNEYGDYDGYDGVNEYTGHKAGGRQARRAGFIRAGIILGAGVVSVLIFDLILPSGSLFQFGEAGTGRMTASYALFHPLRYLNMLLGAFLVNADSLTLNMAGTRLSWLEYTIPAVCIAGLLGVTAVWAVFERDQLRFNGRDKKIFLAVILLELLLTPAMLLSWTPVGSKWIIGLQGRYFLPVLPLIYFVFAKFRLARSVDCPKQEEAEISRNCMRWICVLSCACVYYMLCTYLTR